MDIQRLDLSVRTYNCLRRAEIHTVEELAELTEAELGRIHGLGPRSVKEIRDKIGVATDIRHLEQLDTRRVEPNREAYLNGAEAMKAAIVKAIRKVERQTLGAQRAALATAREIVEKLDMPSLPVVGRCEGYRFFTGTMLIISPYPDTPPEEVCGDWLYIPHKKCWYCDGISYPAESCEIKEGA